MSIQTLSVPDLGGANDVDVIEICVAVGDELELEQSIVVVETDKATMEIPATIVGKVTAVHVSDGDKVNEGDALIDLEVAAASDTAEAEPEPAVEPQQAAEPETKAEPIPEPAAAA